MAAYANNGKICAVVVTYNRKALLKECIEAILDQHHPVDAILVVDNASTDGTPELLHSEGFIESLPPSGISEPWVTQTNSVKTSSSRFIYVRLPRNTGAAGGFHTGIRRAYEEGFDWFWLLDDDSIPLPKALAELLAATSVVEPSSLGFVASKAIWHDGSPHRHVVPDVSPLPSGRPFNAYDQSGVLLIETAAFGSLLVPRKVVSKVGLPIREMFIWGDDTEFTMRIRQSGMLGLYAMKSVVVHKTATNALPDDMCNQRRFYYVRNMVYVSRKWSLARCLYFVARQLWKLPKLDLRCSFDTVRGIFAGLLFKPHVEKLE